jgi:two-component system, sensor histidine kinase and response regulator
MMQDESNPGLSRGFLATEIATTQEKRLAGIAIAISLVGFAIGVPFVRLQLPAIPAFIPAYEAALWVTDTITAILLLSQFARLRSRALLVLAIGYLFDGLMVIPHAFSFPGVFSSTGLMGGGPQTTAWIYMFWHGGFPLFVLAFALLVRRPADALTGRLGVALAARSLGRGGAGRPD